MQLSLISKSKFTLPFLCMPSFKQMSSILRSFEYLSLQGLLHISLQMLLVGSTRLLRFVPINLLFFITVEVLTCALFHTRMTVISEIKTPRKKLFRHLKLKPPVTDTDLSHALHRSFGKVLLQWLVGTEVLLFRIYLLRLENNCLSSNHCKETENLWKSPQALRSSPFR